MELAMTTSDMPEQYCLDCGHFMDTCTSVTESSDGRTTPKAGDVTICFYCGQSFFFNELLMLEKMSPEEYKSVMKKLPDELSRSMDELKTNYAKSRAHLN